eukprot:2051911-Alexandrium_andersonii.AAC.1
MLAMRGLMLGSFILSAQARLEVAQALSCIHELQAAHWIVGERCLERAELIELGGLCCCDQRGHQDGRRSASRKAGTQACMQT